MSSAAEIQLNTNKEQQDLAVTKILRLMNLSRSESNILLLFLIIPLHRFRFIKLKDLSNMNRKRFSLCRELLRNPSVIFFDQSAIHPETESLIGNLKQIAQLGKAVVLTLKISSFRLVNYWTIDIH